MSPGCSVCYFLALNLSTVLEREAKGRSSLDLEVLGPPGIDLFKNALNQKAAFGSMAEIC